MFEPAIDTGGVSREFWRLFRKEVDDFYSIGSSKGHILSKNISSFTSM